MYELQRPDTPEQWEAYHEIRRRVLWQARGRLGEYNAQHADEFEVGNHPMLLTLNHRAIGVVRIDIEGSRAIFRRVAVREDVPMEKLDRARREQPLNNRMQSDVEERGSNLGRTVSHRLFVGQRPRRRFSTPLMPVR